MADYLGAGGQVVGGLASIFSGIGNARRQRENLAYQKQIQQQIFQREDNAVQRRASDMEAAGLSKTLAAGNGAGAGTAVSTTPAKIEGIGEGLKDIGNAGEKALSIKQQSASIETTKNQNKLLLAQADKVKKETDLLGGKKNLQDIDLMYAEAFNERKLSILASEVEQKKNTVQLQEIEKRARELGVTQQLVNLAIAELNKKQATQNLTKGEQEIVAKKLLIEIAEHNNGFWKSTGLPSNTSLDSPMKWLTLLGTQASSATGDGTQFGDMPPMR